MRRRKRKPGVKVVGLSVATRSVGYVVAEAPLFATDWGVKHIGSNSNGEAVKKAEKLLDWERPHVVVVENYAGAGSRRSKRMEELIKEIVEVAIRLGIVVASYSRGVIREAFSSFGVRSKYDIALVLSHLYPCLRSKFPRRKPRIWESEPRGMAVFDAAALLIAHYKIEGWVQ